MTGIANGLTLPNTLANGQTTDASLVMANYSTLLAALNRALLDTGGGSGMNAFGSQIHNLAAGTASTDAATYGQLTGMGASHLALAGGTMTGKLVAEASVASNAGFNIPAGVAPTTPVNGDLWSTSLGFLAQFNGVTKQFATVPGAVVALATNTTLTLAQMCGAAQFTAASVTGTLPASAAAANQTLIFLGGLYGGTVAGNAAETITPAIGPAVNTLPVAPGQFVTLSCNGTGWQVIADSMPAASAPIGGFTGLKIVTQGASNFTSVVTAASLVLTNPAGGVFVAKNVSVSPAINASGSNGLDTGTFAASTWYYVWVIYTPTTATTAGLFSLSSTSPTLPSGYLFSARVGAVRTDSSGNKYLLQTRQYGRRAEYVLTAGTNTTAWPLISGAVTGTWNGSTYSPTAFAWAAFAPATAAYLKVQSSYSGGSTHLAFSNTNPGTYTGYSTTPPMQPYNNSGSGIGVGIITADLPLVSSNIYYASDSSSGNAFYALGWEDNL